MVYARIVRAVEGHIFKQVSLKRTATAWR